jgi:ribosomal protein L10
VGARAALIKNTLAANALRGAGFEPLVPLLHGRCLVAAGDADVDTAKTLLSLTKSVPQLMVLGAMLDQRLLLHGPQVAKLAKLPAREVVHADLISAMAPGTALQIPNPAAHLLAVLQAREAARGDGGDPP